MADDTANSDLTAPNVDDNRGKSVGAGGDTNVTATEEASSPIAGEDSIEDATRTNGHAEQDVQSGGDENAQKSTENPVSGSTNGTPVAVKKNTTTPKKKSSGIPEHKSKKLNKKKSRPALRLDAKPGELYLARMKGHQPWPSVVCDEEMLPQILISSRPITTAQPDGSYKKPEYEDGGKRAYERTFPIMFLQTNEFAWIVNTELTPLSIEECKDATEKGKTKTLIEAYKVAAEGHDLAYFKEMLADHMHAMQEDNEARAEREAKKANKAKRKSVAEPAVVEADDGMEIDEEVGETTKPKNKKRKKSLDSDGGEEKPAKTPKTNTKLKLSTPKTPIAEISTTKKKGAKQTKTSARKSAAKVDNSDEELVDTPKVEEALTPAAAKEKKEKEIRYYRHKLQKGFLSRDTVPSEEEIKSMSSYLGKLEEHPDLEGSIIRATKIHKVLKAMIRLASIPKDEEFHFKKRSHELLQKWNKILQEDPSASAADKEEDAKADAHTNGVSKDTEEDVTKAETEGIAPEVESKESSNNKIGTTVEGDKEAESTNVEEEAKSTNLETDEPNVESAPEESYQPPAETAEVTA